MSQATSSTYTLRFYEKETLKYVKMRQINRDLSTLTREIVSKFKELYALKQNKEKSDKIKSAIDNHISNILCNNLT